MWKLPDSKENTWQSTMPQIIYTKWYCNSQQFILCKQCCSYANNTPHSTTKE